ncbi:MAG: hypothetical protein M3220_19375, partial [Chloroflexota bacterium]|nr:hypothetical protein [Chloroflexota bacterium]
MNYRGKIREVKGDVSTVIREGKGDDCLERMKDELFKYGVRNYGTDRAWFSHASRFDKRGPMGKMEGVV